MSAVKVTISIESELLRSIDARVKEGVFRSRSQAMQLAMGEKIRRLNLHRFGQECSKLDKTEERAWADFGLSASLNESPEY